MEVAYALASSYAKDAMFVEYMAELYGVDVIQEGYFQEADDDKVSFKDKMANLGERAKNLGGKIKEAPGKALEFLKSVGKAILTALSNFWHFITERSLKTCIKKLHALPNELTFPVPVHLKTAVGELLKKTDDFADLVERVMSYKGKKVPNDYDRQETFTKHELIDRPNMKVDVSSEELVGILEELVGADVTGKVKELVKKYKKFIKDLEKASKDEIKAAEDKDQRKALNDKYKEYHKSWKGSLKNIKDRAKDIVSAYAQLIREFRTVANHVVKAETANMKMYSRRAKARSDADERFNKDQERLNDIMYGKQKKMKNGKEEDATNFYGTKPTTPDSGFDDGDDVASNYNNML
jgi:hypothetical protein